MHLMFLDSGHSPAILVVAQAEMKEQQKSAIKKHPANMDLLV
jgi:hypothetical protein